MPKINREEYEVLKRRLDEGYTHIGKNKNGRLQFLLQGSIERDMNHEEWSDGWGRCYMALATMFQFIKWEDSEPYSIAELIKEYEDYQFTADWYAEQFNKLSEAFRYKESEETEVKDIEWLKGKIEVFQKGENMFTAEFNAGVQDTLEYVQELIDQLDEPEKVVVPEFVGEFIADNPQYNLKGLYSVIEQERIYSKLFAWLNVGDDGRGNADLLARAYLNGYKVEKEPLYRARLKVITDEFIASYLRTQSSDAEDRLKALEIGSKYIHEDYRHLSEFTEDELKRLNIWDSEQWEVEELEE